MLEEHKIIDVLLPKKEQMLQLKWYVQVGTPLHTGAHIIHPPFPATTAQKKCR